MKLCLRCNQYFEDALGTCPADNNDLLAVGDNPLIGALINDRYVVDSVIGKGSSGIVYKATRLLMQREVAVKVLHSYLGAESGSLDRFLREARAAARLKHPHIINIWESGVTDDGQPYFVMDYLEGSTLAELVKDKGALPFRRALPIVRQICEALGEAHRQSIVHRDIKPENIVLQESDYASGEDFVKVLDFGIADQASGVPDTNAARQRTAAGSPAYMSPEQCQGFQLDLRSDIYSLAIVVFELLTGARPYEADDIMTLFRMHVKNPPPSLSQVRPDIKFPVKLEMAINKALSKDPNQRQQDVLAFCKDVEESVESFQLDSLSEDGYGLPGSERGAKAISTLVLDANEDEAVGGERLTDSNEPRFEDSWKQPTPEPAPTPLPAPAAPQPSTFEGNGGMSSSDSTPQFSIPIKPSSPGIKPVAPELEIEAAANLQDRDTEIQDAEAATRLLESAKRASQSFKTNLSNSGKEDVSDWARQILQRKSTPNVQTVSPQQSPDNGIANKTGSAFARESGRTEAASTEAAAMQMPRITPVPPLESLAEDSQATPPSPSQPQITPAVSPSPLTAAALALGAKEPVKESEQHVSAWARQILKRGGGESSAKIPILRMPNDALAAQPLLGASAEATAPYQPAAETAPAQAEPANAEHHEAPASGDFEAPSADAAYRSESESDAHFDPAQQELQAPEQEFVQSHQGQESSQSQSSEPAALEAHASRDDRQQEIQQIEPGNQIEESKEPVTASDTSAAPNGSHLNTVKADSHPLGKLSDEIGKQPGARGKMSIQDAIDAQRKETGKFSSKDVEAWGAMLKNAGSSAPKPTGATPDGVNVLHRIASTSNTPAATPKSTYSNQQAYAKEKEEPLLNANTLPGRVSSTNLPAAQVPAKTPITDRDRFELPVSKKVEPSTKFAKEVERVLDAAIVKPGDAHKPPVIPSAAASSAAAEAAKSGRIDSDPNFDANRFEQPINKKAENLNPFAREVEKVIDSAIIKGRRTADDTGMMKSINLDMVADAAKPAVKKDPPKPSSHTGGPDLKKLLSRRRSDGSSPNLLNRAQEALRSSDGDQTSMSVETEEAHVLSDEGKHELDAQTPSTAPEIVDVENIEETFATADGAGVGSAAETAAAYQLLESLAPPAEAAAEARAYSLSDLEAIGRGALAPPVQEAESQPIGTPAQSEAPKVPIRLDKMRAAGDAKASHPGFGDKLKSMFGKKGEEPLTEAKSKDLKDKNTKSGISALEKDKKETKSGMAPVGKDKDKGTKSGMPAATDKNTKSGMPAAKEKGTKSGLAAIGAFFGGGKNKGVAAAADAIAAKAAQTDSPIPLAGSIDIAASAANTGFSTPQYNDQPPSFISSFKPTPEFAPAVPDIQPSAPEFLTPEPIHAPAGPNEAEIRASEDAARAVIERPLMPAAPPETLQSSEPVESIGLPQATEAKPESAPNDFERAIAEALALEEARVNEEEAAEAERIKAERAEREAGAAARAMAEIQAQEQARAIAESEAEAAAKAEADAAETAKTEAEAAERAKTEAEAAERAKTEAEAAERAKAEAEAAEEAKRQAEQLAAEARAKAEQEAREAAIARREQEAAAAAARALADQAQAEATARAEQEAAAARAAQEAVERARAEQEAMELAVNAEREAAFKASAEQEAQAAAAAAAMANARAQQEAEAKVKADNEAAAAAAAAAAIAASTASSSPQIVDTPSKMSGKASQSQLAQMLNRFAKKGANQASDAATPIPPVIPAPMPTQAPMPLQAPMPAAAQLQQMAPGEPEVDDQATKSQKKFAELAQRLKSNAASRAADGPVSAPGDFQQPPAFQSKNTPQPYDLPQGEFGGSSFGSNMHSSQVPGAAAAAAAGLGAAIGAGIGAFAAGAAQSPQNFGMPEPGSAPFPEGRMDDGSNEPVKPEALNKKIEAVKKRIEAFKAGGVVPRPESQFEPPKVFDDSPKPAASNSSANMAGGPPVNRLLEAAQRAVETGSVSRLPAQRIESTDLSPEPNRFDPPQPITQNVKAPMPVEAPPPPTPSPSDSAARAGERKDPPKNPPSGVKDSYSSFRNIEQSVKSERVKGVQKEAPDRARVRQSFNKPRRPIFLILAGCAAIVVGVIGFGPFMKALPSIQAEVQTRLAGIMHQAPAKTEAQEPADIDELIQAGHLDQARSMIEKSTKSGKWTPKDSERYMKIAAKYAASDVPEYDSAIEVLNKIPRKAPMYRKAQKLAKTYASAKRRAGSH